MSVKQIRLWSSPEGEALRFCGALNRNPQNFGRSRPTIYEAQENFRDEGIRGLLPQKRGPKKARKLTAEVRLYLEELVGSEPDIKAPVLAKRVRRRSALFSIPAP